MISKGLIFTYVMTYGGAIVSLFSPFHGLLIYVCFGIIKPERTWHWSVPIGSYSRIVAIALLIGWVLKGFGNWKLGWAKVPTAFYVVFVCGAAISGMFAPFPDIAWRFVEIQLKFLLPFLVAVTTINNWSQVRQLAWVIILSQGYLGFEQNLSYFQHAIPVGDNEIAHMMMLGAAVAGVAALHFRPIWKQAVCAGLSALMAHAVMFHMSRGAMLGLGAGGIAAFFAIRKKPVHYLVIAIAILVAARMAGPSVRDELNTISASDGERDASAQSRFDLWRDMWDATKKNPIFGIGPNHWQQISHTYGWPHGKDGHGLWVQMPCEIGIPAGNCLLGFYLSLIVLLWPVARLRDEQVTEGSNGYAQMVISACVGFIVEEMFGSLSGADLPYFVGMLGAATLKLAWLPVDRGQRKRRKKRRRRREPVAEPAWEPDEVPS